MNMAQLMENAKVADDLIQGKLDEDGFKTRRKEPQGRQFLAKGNVTSRLTVPPFKKKPFAGSKPFARNRPFNSKNRYNAENQQFRPPPFSGQRQGFKRHFTGKISEERKALRDAKKRYICEEEGHFANECPQRNSQNKDDKSDRKGKKPKPSAGLVPDLVGDQQNVDATELCRAWGKVRDQEVLVFFDPRARANFISPELASKLGIRAEEMGMTGEAGELPPAERPEDHRIDVVPGSSPPNRPPYRVSAAQQKDYESGVNLLVLGLSEGISDRDLASLFHPYGGILFAKVMVDAKSGQPQFYGIVTMENAQAAEAAAVAVTGMFILGRRIKVEMQTREQGPLLQGHAQHMLQQGGVGPMRTHHRAGGPSSHWPY
ncbi:hypothetical protein L7F22_020518 [Adiantum nelumboides]|nr:hypothetical protein [Adiantum nelumboides]